MHCARVHRHLPALPKVLHVVTQPYLQLPVLRDSIASSLMLFQVARARKILQFLPNLYVNYQRRAFW